MNYFDQYYKTILHKVLEKLNQAHIELVIVGGTVRDYLIFKKFGHDVDAELIFRDNDLSPDEAFSIVVEILKSLEIKIEILPFYIVKFSLENHQFEFSIGRLEKYIEGNFSHKNFIPHFLLGDEYAQKWLRRDVTINAIGYSFKSGKIIDPYNGMEDLKSKTLRPISEDFYRDPVRLLRLIRFRMLMNFNISTVVNLNNFNMQALTNYYLFKEGEKVGLSEFFQVLSSLQIDFNDHQKTYIEFAKMAKFINFREMVYQSAKQKNSQVQDTIYKDGLFSFKKYKILLNFFNLENLTDRRNQLGLIKNLGNDFYKWASDDC